MSIEKNLLRGRTKQFALRVIRFVRSLPRDKVMDELGRQLLRCACSTAANYRAACRAKSRADFIAKMGIVEEESDEALFWMEVFVEAELVKPRLLSQLMTEADEITALVVASIRTAKARKLQSLPHSPLRTPHSALL
jgi:four helix bundle protein